MPAPAVLGGLVGTFLNRVGPNAEVLPNPFGDDFTAPGQSADRAFSVRVRGLLAQLAEKDREIASGFEQQRKAVTQDFISRRLLNTTAYDSKLRELYRKEEADRSSWREQWYRGLAPPDQTAFDNHCLAVAGAAVLLLFPPDLPVRLHGPLARLTLEYAAFVRRWNTRRSEVKKSLTNRGLGNPATVESILDALASDEKEGRSRLEGQWYRELPPDQPAESDSSGDDSRGARSRGRRRLTPERLAEYRDIKERWERAKSAGVRKEQFCQDNHISLETLETALRTCRRAAHGS
jgi:hypothetical protein